MSITQNQYTVARRRASVMAAILLLVAGRVQAQTYTIAPMPFLYVWNTSGAIVPNGCVWTYAAGTTTPIATYSDNAGTLNGNPIIADNYGRFVAYLLPGTNYKFLYEATPCSSSGHGSTIKTQDVIQGVPASASNVDVTGTAGETITAGQCVYLSDGSGSKTQGQWYKCDSANTYSATLPVVGFAPSAISSATTGTIRIAGYLTGLSSLTAGAPYFVSSSAGSITASAPANRRLVGVADTTTSLVVAPNPALMTAAASGTASSSAFLRGDQTWSPAWSEITTTSTGTQNDFAPGLVGNTIVRCNNASLLTINGFASGYDGQRVLLVSIGAGQVDLAQQAGGSAAANRLINFATTAATSLAAGAGTAEYVYDATTARWRLVAHEQGAWITPTYAGGNFTASSGNWTVGSGDVVTMRYRLSGRQVTLIYGLQTTTVSATPTALKVGNGEWGGFTSAAFEQQVVASRIADNSAGPTFATNAGLVQLPSGSTVINLYKDATATATFAISTDQTHLYGMATFEVQ